MTRKPALTASADRDSDGQPGRSSVDHHADARHSRTGRLRRLTSPPPMRIRFSPYRTHPMGQACPRTTAAIPPSGRSFRITSARAWRTCTTSPMCTFGNVSPHIAFRDPWVFLLHSNVDRLYAKWQTDPNHPERLEPTTVYGSESNLDVNVNAVGLTSTQNLTHLVEPWSTGHGEFSATSVPGSPRTRTRAFPMTTTTYPSLPRLATTRTKAPSASTRWRTRSMRRRTVTR